MTADELYKAVRPFFDGINAVQTIEGTLRDLCWYTERICEVQREIDEYGTMVETPRGRVANPACAILHQYMVDKNSCLKCITPLLGKGEAKDEFMDYIRGNR